MSLINVIDLTFGYEGSYVDVFENVSFQIDTDWKLGFCGRNGCGKTTFLNLLMDKYEYTGTISKMVDFEYFPFSVSDPSLDVLAVIESIAVGVPLWQIRKELFMLAVSEDVLYRPFSTLSEGEKTKVLLASLFLKENRYLLIDEPTNHLDSVTREIVASYLNSKKGFILVSHDRYFLDECCDHTLYINKTNIEVVNGNFSVFWEHKQRQDAFEIAQNVKLSKEIDRLKIASKRTARWADKAESAKIGFDPKKVEKSKNRRPYEGAKSKKMMQASKSIQLRQQTNIDEKSKLLRNIETADTLKIHELEYFSSNLVILEKLSVIYDNRRIFKPISFSFEQSDRIAILGVNGSGKSSILKLICGMDIPYEGQLFVGNRLKISFVPQDASFLEGSLADFIKDNEIDETLFKTILIKMNFTKEQFDTDISDYSAGQKKKVLLACSLSQTAHLYIWDEPLNYIDILSRIQIEELILSHSPPLIFVEHDKTFCENIATKSILLER
ncbi:MAG: ABC-F type ribosomal protection protein [Oscillospiraceae bacterium]|nr:ABC-F type ribosomal protection protein [Oscillospiraceae bacterium]